jgi:hypothetical protein
MRDLLQGTRLRQVREAFTLIGLLVPGELPSHSEEEFAMSILRFAPFAWWPWRDNTLWLARQLAAVYDVSPARVPECVRRRAA